MLIFTSTGFCLLISALMLCYPLWGCRGTKTEQKIDPRLKLMLRQHADQPEQPIAVLIKFKQPLSETQKKELGDKGVKLQTEIGNISSATLPVGAIATVAKFGFVEYIEHSKSYRLNPEPEEQ